MIRFRPSASLLAATLIAALLPAERTAAQRTEVVEAQRNEFDHPVRLSSGAIVEYTLHELQKQAAEARRPSDPPSGSSEGGGVAPTWKWHALGTGLGLTGIAIARTLGGRTEIVLGGGGSGFGGNRGWFVLAHDTASGGYVPEYTSEPYDGIARIAVGDVRSEPGNEIVIVNGNGRVEIWSQETRRLLHAFTVTGQERKGLFLFDVDRDGAVEIVLSSADFSNSVGTFGVYAGNGAIEWSLPERGTDVIAAQMDDDAAIEIALTSGRIIDADTRGVQWTWNDGFGQMLEAADIDADGRAELVTAQGTEIWAYDVERRLPKWSNPGYSGGVAALTVGDVDGDGDYEVIVGAAQWGEQVAYDALTWQQQWVVQNPEHGTTDNAFGDVDGDGQNELLWGAGHTSSGPDYFFVANPLTGQHEWQSEDLVGPFRGPVLGDVTGDGVPELVTLCNESDSGYGGGRILVFDDAPGRPVRRAISQEIVGGLTWQGSRQVRLVQWDADPAREILVAASRTYDGQIEIYDYDGASTFTKVWDIATPLPSGPFWAADVADVDRDGELEVVGGAAQRVYVFGKATRTIEWQSLIVAQSVVAVELGDSDGDGNLEIHALGDDGDVYVFDGVSKQLETIEFGNHSALEILRGSGRDLLLLGDTTGGASGLLDAGAGYTKFGPVPIAGARIDGFTFDGPCQWFWTAASGRVLMKLGTATVWQSAAGGDGFGGEVVILPRAGLLIGAGANGLTGFPTVVQ